MKGKKDFGNVQVSQICPKAKSSFIKQFCEYKYAPKVGRVKGYRLTHGHFLKTLDDPKFSQGEFILLVVHPGQRAPWWEELQVAMFQAIVG